MITETVFVRKQKKRNLFYSNSKSSLIRASIDRQSIFQIFFAHLFSIASSIARLKSWKTRERYPRYFRRRGRIQEGNLPVRNLEFNLVYINRWMTVSVRERKRRISRTIKRRRPVNPWRYFPERWTWKKEEGEGSTVEKGPWHVPLWRGLLLENIQSRKKIHVSIARNVHTLPLMGFVLFNFRPTRGEKSRRHYFLFASSSPQLSPTAGIKVFPRIDARVASSFILSSINEFSRC